MPPQAHARRISDCGGGDEKLSVLDLFGGGFILLSGHEGQAWNQMVHSQTLVRFHQIGGNSGTFESLYGIEKSGAVLVRPDGYVGARFSDDTNAVDELRTALGVILGR